MKIVKPIRVTRSYTQKLVAAPDTVFALLCPVREADWIDGWDPLRVVTASGAAEPDCVFTTAATPADAIWYITRHAITTCATARRCRPVAARHATGVVAAVAGLRRRHGRKGGVGGR